MLPLTIARTSKSPTSPSKLQISAVGTAGLLVCLAAGAAGGGTAERILDEKTNPWGITVQSVGANGRPA